MANTPALPRRCVELFRDRDPALDEAWGEGADYSLHRAPDGTLWEEVYRYHIDFDGSTRVRQVDVSEAITGMLRHNGRSRVPALFPDAPETRLIERFGTCDLDELEDQAHAIADGSARVTSVVEGELYGAVGGPFVVCSSDGEARLISSEDALAALREVGADRAVFETWFSTTLEAQLFAHWGLSTWLEARERLHERVETAERIYSETRDAGQARWTLYTVPTKVFIAETARGSEFRYALLQPVDALWALVGTDCPQDRKQRYFPDSATWEAVQQRAGISFPAADESLSRESPRSDA